MCALHQNTVQQMKEICGIHSISAKVHPDHYRSPLQAIMAPTSARAPNASHVVRHTQTTARHSHLSRGSWLLLEPPMEYTCQPFLSQAPRTSGNYALSPSARCRPPSFSTFNHMSAKLSFDSTLRQCAMGIKEGLSNVCSE